MSKSATGEKFYSILVVTCALTRFSLFIPVKTQTADETLRVLLSRVFSIFGHPLVVVSDNGPAFRSQLADEMAAFFGYRNIRILPYNAQANGTAEASVQRIKLLLERQTRGLKNWHSVVPLSQLLLNSTVHTSTGVTPFMALFGHAPNGLERLEDPSLLPEPGDGDGETFLRTLRQRLLDLHAELKSHSDSIKKARADEENARVYARLKSSKFGEIKEGGYAYLLHGSKAQAAHVHKHGHGAPWKHRYKVLRVRPHAALLEVPTDGSVPRVQEWQLMRRLVPAAEDEHAPGDDAPDLTEKGIPLPTSGAAAQQPSQGSASAAFGDGDIGGDEQEEDDESWEVECVSHAVKEGTRYLIYLKWKDSDEVTPRYADELRKESKNPELLKEIKDAIAAARSREAAETRGSAVAEPEEDALAAGDSSAVEPGVDEPFVPPPPPAVEEAPDEPNIPDLISARLGRERKKPVRFNPGALMAAANETMFNISEYNKALCNSELFYFDLCDSEGMLML